jgi:tetratricopeptide (TPR) repeat protein
MALITAACIEMFLSNSPHLSRVSLRAVVSWSAAVVLGVLLITGTGWASTPDTALAGIESLIQQSKLDEAAAQLQALLERQSGNARATGLLGTVRLKQNNLPEAETLFRNAAELNPKSVDLCLNLANLLRDEARWPEAAAQYNKCRALAPSNTKVAVELVTALEKSGSYSKSLSVLTSIPASSRPTKLLPVIAADYLATKQSARAQEAVGQVLQHASDDPKIVPELATTFLDRGLVSDAAVLLKVSQSRQQENAEYLTVLAKVQAAQGNVQQARSTYDRAVKQEPKSQQVLAAGADLAIRWGQWDKALEFLDAALAAGPPRSDLLQSVVFVELRKQDLQAAHDVARQWHSLRPNEPASALAFAIVLVEGNHWGEARPLLEKVLAASPDDKGAQLAMGVVLYNAGELASSKKFLLSSLGGSADDANAHYFLGLIAKQEGDAPAAVQQMEQSIAVQAVNPRAFSQLGQLYLQQNDLPKARAALEKAVEQAPGEPQNHYELARVYNKLGMKQQADEQFALFQKLRPQRPSSPPGEAAPRRQ